MLREPQHEREILNDIKTSPFVPSIDSGQTLSVDEGTQQRRRGRKGRRITMNNFSKIIHLLPPNLACFAPWRESSPLIEISPDYCNTDFMNPL
jgi:hypothetical protein